MSISIGIYELFAYTVPGVVYIYVINEFLRLLNFPHVDISKLDNIAQLSILAVIAYISTHIFDSITRRIWVPLFMNEDFKKESLESFKRERNEVDIQFTADQSQLIASAICHSDKDFYDRIAMLDVLYMMLRNISFGFLLFSILQLAIFWKNNWEIQFLIIALLSFVVAIILIYRSKQFRKRYFQYFYSSALCYGTSIEQILHLPSSKKTSIKPTPQPKSSPDSNIE